MSKGKWTHPDVKKHYTMRALQERKAIKDGKLTLDALVKRVTKELKGMGKTPPAPSTLKREMSLIINRQPSVEDQPWHMGTFKVYNHSAAGLVAIWKAYRFVVDQRAMRRGDTILATVESDSMLTIRQAKWIARLDPVVRMLHQGLDEDVLVPLVIDHAIFYAEDEVLCEVMGVPFNTETHDGNLARGFTNFDGSDVNRFRRQVFSNLCLTKRTEEEMKRSFDDPLQREIAELTAESKKRKPSESEFWSQYNERINSLYDRMKIRDLDEWEREEEERWQKRIGATNPELPKEMASALRSAIFVSATKPPNKWTDEDRRKVDEYNRLEIYAESLAESLEASQTKDQPAKKARSRGKKEAK